MPDLYEVIDPRPVAALAKYTFFLPSAARIDAIAGGDLVQVTVRAIPNSMKWDAERLWVRVHSVEPDWLEGPLESQPDDMPLVSKGMTIRLPRTHVINVVFEDPDKEEAILADQQREFWERCWVDQAVLDGELPVGFIYREEPEPIQDGERFADSGWRIRGDMRGASAAQLAERKIAYVALGAVLNKDDSWVHLIDEPTGASYDKDFDKSVFVQSQD